MKFTFPDISISPVSTPTPKPSSSPTAGRGVDFGGIKSSIKDATAAGSKAYDDVIAGKNWLTVGEFVPPEKRNPKLAYHPYSGKQIKSISGAAVNPAELAKVAPKDNTTSSGGIWDKVQAAGQQFIDTAGGPVLTAAMGGLNPSNLGTAQILGAKRAAEIAGPKLEATRENIEKGAGKIQGKIEDFLKGPGAPAAAGAPGGAGGPGGSGAGTVGETSAEIQALLRSIGGPGAVAPVSMIKNLANFTPSESTIKDPGLEILMGKDTSQYSADQKNLIKMLMDQAAGQGGPSPAELMLARQQQQTINQAQALAAGQSGRALPASMRQVQNLAATSAQDAAQQAAILRAKEQQDAQGLASTAVAGARGADLAFIQEELKRRQGALATQAGNELAAQTAAAEAKAREDALRTKVLGDAASTGVQLSSTQLQAALDAYKGRLSADAAKYASDTQRLVSDADRAAAAAQGQQAREDKIVGGILQGGVTAATSGMALTGESNATPGSTANLQTGPQMIDPNETPEQKRARLGY